MSEVAHNTEFSLSIGRYKSFDSIFEWKNIPDFAILTGENGAGKTQLLEMIHQAIQKPNSSISINGSQIQLHEVAYFPKSWDFVNNPQPIDQSSLNGELKSIATVLQSGQTINSQVHTKYLREKIEELTGQSPTSLSLEQIIDALPKNANFPRVPDPNYFCLI